MCCGSWARGPAPDSRVSGSERPAHHRPSRRRLRSCRAVRTDTTASDRGQSIGEGWSSRLPRPAGAMFSFLVAHQASLGAWWYPPVRCKPSCVRGNAPSASICSCRSIPHSPTRPPRLHVSCAVTVRSGTDTQHETAVAGRYGDLASRPFPDLTGSPG